MDDNLSRKNKGISPSITLAITAKAKKMVEDGEDIISFGAGEPDFKTPSYIREAGIEAIKTATIGYTSASGLISLKEAICEKLLKDNHIEYAPENIIISNGAKHSLFNALQAICNPGDEVIIPAPYWVSYPELVKLADATPVHVETKEEDSFKMQTEDFLSAITEKTKAIIINSPSNPTGTVYTREELLELGKIAVEHNLYIISDEIYEKLIYEGSHVSIASLGEEIKNRTIVINGLSKCYAMTGWRIGYTAASNDIIKIMTNIQSHSTSNPNTVAQYAAIAALKGDQGSVEEMKVHFNKRRDYMVEKINEINLLSAKLPHGAFYVMVNISEVFGKEFEGYRIDSSLDLAEYLLDKGKVAVVPGIGFGTDEYIRLSYATSMDDIVEGLNRIENALK